jgi:hypothetical protein
VAADSAPAEEAAAEAQDLAKMTNSGRIIGIVLVAAAALLCLGALAWLVSAALSEGLTISGAVLGGLLVLILAAPLAGVGVFLLIQGTREERSMAEAKEQRKLLNIVKTQGQVTISDLVLELDSNHDQVKNWIYDLVGKGLFSGYVNWEEGFLYSQQASQLRDETRCKHCGGAIRLAGKGVVSCPFCGTEYFLS